MSPASFPRVGITQELSVEFGDEVIPEMLETADVQVLLESQRRLRMLCTLGWGICEFTTLSDVLNTAMQAVERLTGAKRCFVIVQDAKNLLVARASRPVELPVDQDQWPISRTLVQQVLSTGRALLSSDAMQDFATVASVHTKHIRSIICVPLGFRPSPLGVIYADNCIDEGTFTELDLRFLTALSHFVYLSMRNALELEKVDEQRQLSDDRWKAMQDELLHHQIVGNSQALLKAYERLKQVASTNRPLLLLGQTGVGKDLFAKAAHSLSDRNGKPFVRVDVAALSADLIESELFGHVQGAFTNAIRDKRGRFELADGGTLFLDEIGNIPLRLQAKLLRVLESGEFERVGGEKVIKTNVRIISATNVDLESAIRNGEFREDLYYRIAGVSVHIPALAERLGDIPDLVRYILADSKSTKVFDQSAIRCLQSYSWPGNVRQLIRVVGEIDATCAQPTVTAGDVPSHIMPGLHCHDKSRFMELRKYTERLESQYVQRALALCDGDNNEAIRVLNISREKFFKIKKRMTAQE